MADLEPAELVAVNTTGANGGIFNETLSSQFSFAGIRQTSTSVITRTAFLTFTIDSAPEITIELDPSITGDNPTVAHLAGDLNVIFGDTSLANLVTAGVDGNRLTFATSSTGTAASLQIDAMQRTDTTITTVTSFYGITLVSQTSSSIEAPGALGLAGTQTATGQDVIANVTHTVVEIPRPGTIPSTGDGTRLVEFTDVSVIAQGVNFGNVPLPPVVLPDSFDVDQDTRLDVAVAAGVLGNDSDPGGVPLQAELVDGVGNGTLLLNGDGSFSYTPEPGFSGTDAFTYLAFTEKGGRSDPVTVSLTVNRVLSLDGIVSDGPIAGASVVVRLGGDIIAGPVITDQNGAFSLRIPFDAVLAGSPDERLVIEAERDDILLVSLTRTVVELDQLAGPDGGLTFDELPDLKVTNVSTAAHAVADANDDGVVDTDEIAAFETALANDQTVPQLVRTLSGIIRAVIEDPSVGLPAGIDDTLALANAFDGDGPDEAAGAAENAAREAFIASNADAVDIAIAGTLADPIKRDQIAAFANNAPVAVDDEYRLDPDGTFAIDPPGVGENDVDPDGDTFTVVLVTAPGNGTLALNPDGSFTYSANVDFNDIDSFTYRLNDGFAESNEATVFLLGNLPPVINILQVEPGTIDEGSEVTLNLVFEDPDADDIHTVNIDWGDGTDLETIDVQFGDRMVMPTHTYADGANSYTINATLTDAEGLFDTETATVLVANVAPVATVSGAAAVAEGATYTLTVSDFFDPGTDTVSALTVDWGDGTPAQLLLDPDLSAPVMVEHVFADGPATPTITVTATDEDGTFGLGTVAVTVANVAPVATVSGAAAVAEGATYTLTVSDFFDPGTDTVSALTVDWGDGTPAQLLLDPDLSAPVMVEHVFADGPATPTITVTATDEDGTFGLGTVAVTVANVAPVATVSGAAAVAEGATYTLTVSDFFDPGTDTVSALTVDWGDGTPAQLLLDPDLSAPVMVEHVFADGPATPTITVTATDEDGTFGLGTVAVTVANVAPVATVSGAAAVAEGATYTLTVSDFFDPGTDTVSALTVDWGDGTPAQLLLDPDLSAPVMVEHVFADGPAMPTITVTATDEDGTFGLGTVAVTVANVAPVVDALVLDPVEIDEDGTVMVSGSFSDAGTLDTHTGVIDWGDGGPAETLVLNPDGIFTASHRYLDDRPGSEPDTYTITATVTDDDDGVGTASATVTVVNVAPEITFLDTSANFVGAAGEDETIFLTGNFFDIGTLDTHSAMIDWGDGSIEAATIAETGGSGTISGSHAYVFGGIYDVVVSLTDDDTGADSAGTISLITGAGVNDGELQVVGTTLADDVSIRKRSNNRLKVSADFLPGRSRMFDAVGIESIRVLVGDGNDEVGINRRVRTPASIDGGAGNDELSAGGGDTLLIGGPGIDVLKGGSGDDLLVGGTGDDVLKGGSGDDVLLGGEGNDYLIGGSGDDLLDGGSGEDRLRGDGTDDDDDDPGGFDVLLGGDGDDNIRGGGGGDLIDGEAGNDVIFGESGDDVLLGGAGDDYIRGGSGADTLEGGDGVDQLSGGSGPDSVEQETGAGPLGLLGVFQQFKLVFGPDDFSYVDPNPGVPMADDRPPRLWIQDYLNSVPGNQPTTNAVTQTAMVTRVFNEELNAFVELGEMKQLEQIDGGVAAAGLPPENGDPILVDATTAGEPAADKTTGATGAGRPPVNWDTQFSGFAASP